ncbi:CHASE domain-containing protein [Erythrobacter sp. SDW2]|uniref:CHASE domain-containing protein n=1 Tax=Erythrobacter sp. SDW2 TaxID=2907154 RepID=UPI001F2D92AC|nr:CHASE domain-containing protein [Erythrobacter sp. SDW2]UIP06756.1 CHASE domain-containing protein [Erythrobacter sp. SDW2]
MASTAPATVGRSGRWLLQYPRAVPVAIFLLVASVTLLSVFAIERGESRREQVQIDQVAGTIGATLERRASTSSAYLRAGAALFATVDAVPLALFSRFAEELRLDDQYRLSGGIGWAEVIAPESAPEFEARIGRQLGRKVRVYRMPAAPKLPSFVPVAYSLPDSERVQRAIGFDMYSEPVRREAMETAARNQEPIASRKVILVSGGDGPRPGFVIFMPVYGQAGDERALRGFIYSPFDGQEFLNGAMYSGLIGQRTVRLFDGPRVGANLIATHQEANGVGQTSEVRIMVGNRPMTVQVQSADGNSLTSMSMLTLLFGLAVASLSMLVARLLTQQAQEDLAAIEYYAEQNSIRNSLTRELNHRVKNTLANVLSIIALTRRRTDNLDDFAQGLDGRIRALSATHDLLTQSEWGTTPLRQVVVAEMAPYASSDASMIELDGPDVELAPNDALSFGLAIHELATNAAKYGALSAEGGMVSINWQRENNDTVRVEWRESGGPRVPTERPRGFGTELIERIVAHELRHPVELDFAEEGVRCVLRVPVRKPSEFAIRAPRQA